MVNVTLEGTEKEVKEAIKLLRNVTEKNSCAVLEKSWYEEDGHILVKIVFYPEAKDLYCYMDDQIYPSFKLLPRPIAKVKDKEDFWQWASIGDMESLFADPPNSHTGIVEAQEGTLLRCDDGVYVVKEKECKKTKISKNSDLPLFIEQ